MDMFDERYKIQSGNLYQRTSFLGWEDLGVIQDIVPVLDNRLVEIKTDIKEFAYVDTRKIRVA